MSEKGFNIIARVAGFILLLVLAVFLLVQIPSVQTKVSQYFVDKVFEKFDGELDYSSVRVYPFNSLVIKDLVLTDKHPYTEDVNGRGWEPVDTLFSAGSVSASFSLKGLFKHEGLHLGRVSIKDAQANIVSEPDSVYKSNIARMFGLKHKDGRPEPGPDIFDIRKADIDNFRFTLRNFGEDKGIYNGHGINFEDMDVRVEKLDASRLKFTGGRMYGTVNDCRASEKGGYIISKLSGSCGVGQGLALIEDLKIKDPWSDLNLDKFSMSFDRVADFSDFLEKIEIEGDLRRSRLSMPTLTNIAGLMPGNEMKLDIAGGSVSGTVSDLDISGLTFSEPDSGTSGRLSGHITGLPDIGGMTMDVSAEDLEFTTAGLTGLIREATGNDKVDLRAYAPGQNITANAKVKGSLNALDADISAATSNAGSLNASGKVTGLMDGGNSISLKNANVETRKLDVSRLAGIEQVGPVSLKFSGDASIGSNGITADVRSLDVGSVAALGREFRNISVSGVYTPDSLNAILSSNDPDLKFTLKAEGSGKIADGNANYTLSGNISEANLKALQLDTREDMVLASASLNGTLESKPGAGLSARLDITDALISGQEGSTRPGDMAVLLETDGDSGDAHVESEFLDAYYSGGTDIAKMIEDIQAITTRKHLPALYKKSSDYSGQCGEYNVALSFHKPGQMLEYISPKLYVEDSTAVTINVDENGFLTGTILSPRLAYNGSFLKNVRLDIDNYDGLNAMMTSDEINLGGFAIHNPALTALGEDNEFNVQLHYDDMAGLGGYGELFVNGEISRNEADSLLISAFPLDSYLMIGGETWDITGKEISYDGKSINVDDFLITSGSQRLWANGSIAKGIDSRLDVFLDDFELAVIDKFLNKPYGFSGIANGEAWVQSPSEKMGVGVKLYCDDVRVSGAEVGDFQIAGNWNQKDNRLNAFIGNTLHADKVLEANVSYALKDKYVNGAIDLHGFSPKVAEPFLAGIFSEVGGSISGSLGVTGPLKHLNISGENTRFDNLWMTLEPTGATYSLDGPFDVKSDGIYFTDVNLSDMASGTGRVTGSFRFGDFTNPVLDTRVTFNRLLALDKRTGGSFYGHLLASGDATAKGPLSAISVDARVNTTDIGNVHVSLGSSAVGATSDLLTFVERNPELDNYEKRMLEAEKKEDERKSKSDFTAKARVTVSPDVSAVLEIDPEAGNMLSAFGQGSVDLFLRPSKDLFTLNGDYNVSGGKFRFAAAGVIDKEFTIQDGGSIKFGGDVMDSDLDITAMYNLKASLAPLIADSTAVDTRRAVECGINISDKIRNPRIAFSINVPDLDPTTKANIESALNTEDKVQKQFVSLLLLGSFLPSESSGVINGSNMLLSNVTEVIAGQFNSILQKLDIPLDLGFNYQPGSGGTDIFDVAISTQLFNNRVVVNGSFGNRQYKSSAGAADMVGDLDVAVKLGRQGDVRVNLFSHSADDYTNYLDYSQRSGAGISYQKEYNKFREVIRSIFRGRRIRQYRRMIESGQIQLPEGRTPERRPRESREVTIEIEQ